jgi:uncharacterized UPF0160 family protein
VYDPGNRRFDHHQRGFSETLHDVRLSSAGLIWKNYGHTILLAAFNLEGKYVDVVHRLVYRTFVKSIDLADNGVLISDDSTCIVNRIKRRNPDHNWNDHAEKYYQGMVSDQLFNDAVMIMQGEFREYMIYILNHWLHGFDYVIHLYLEAMLEKKGYILFEDPNNSYNFKDYMDEIEYLDTTGSKMFYSLSYDTLRSQWNAIALPVSSTNTSLRMPFPQEWRGLSGQSLEATTRVPGSLFVHLSGFMASHKTKEGLVELVKISIAGRENKRINV